jgi:hypothetical protein
MASQETSVTATLTLNYLTGYLIDGSLATHQELIRLAS